MRVIKFRGRRTDNGEFEHGYYHRGELSGSCFINGWDVEESTVGQFTGLLDKNGVEIYEGDKTIDHVGIGIVKYSEKDCAFFISYGFNTAKWFYDYSLKGELESIEVIGNIHEGEPIC